MKQIKPGMLCFLTRCRDSRTNGKVVTVIRKYNHIVCGDGWMVESVSPVNTVMFHLDCSEWPDTDTKFFAAANQLIPIDADPEGTENEAWLPLHKESAFPKEMQCKPMHA